MRHLHGLILVGFLFMIYLDGCYGEDDCPKETDFMCRSDKKCIDSSRMCDKVSDCADHSDEEYCECQQPDWYLCKDNTTCISHSARCDDHFDCPAKDDEDDCKEHTPHHERIMCSKNEFTCLADNLCLPLELVCDGVKNCMDGTDETIGCLDIEKSCKGFLCKNKHCLTDSDWVCDGHNDCGDNSDEEQNCVYDCSLEHQKFLCNNSAACIPIEKVCDRKKDCSDGSDESSECETLKTNKICTSFECPSIAKCTILPWGPTCICPKGYKFNATNKKCEDINECLTFGICSHGCFNTEGSYKCLCAPKFKLESDNRTCVVISSTDPLLIFAGNKAVNALTLKTKHFSNVAKNLNQVIGVSFDGYHVYWTDISLQVESIMRAKQDGTQIETLLTSGLASPEDIAVDYFTGNIYLTDNGFKHIAVCSNDGRFCTALVNENVHKPRGIVLHPQKGTMYWSDWGSNPMIAIAAMDGTSNRPLISDDIHWPNGLALDWPNERLYWVDAKLKSIESCNLNGGDRRSVIKNVSKHPYGIAVFQSNLYWSDWDSKSIQSCDKFTGKNRTTIVRDNKIYDVHIYHSAMQGVGVNSCSKNQCSHLCLLAMNNTYTCACPKYMELNVDKHTCQATEKQKIVLMGVGNRLVTFEHQSFGRHNDGEGKTFNFQIHKMAYNSITGDVLVADNIQKAIFRIDLKDYAAKKIISENIGNVTALTYDNYANNLYWSDAERSTVEVYSFHTRQRAVIHHFMGSETPIALAAIPEVGKLFVALKSTAHTHTHIDMLLPHGRGPHYHILEEGIGNGPIELVPDHALKEVFWSDYELAKIGYTDYDGTMHHTFLHGIQKPVSLAIVGEDIFWTTSKSLKLNWTPKHSFVGTKTMNIEQPLFSLIPQAIVLLSITPLTVSKHHCTTADNGGCSHICVAIGESSHSCLCPTGMVFKDSNNQTCISASECYFRCGSGECIGKALKCNGFKDCVDNSDEDGCGNSKKVQITCNNEEFACADGTKCIPRNSRCDQTYDCDDKTDELDCKNYDRKTKCNIDQHVCSDGECISKTSLCDGFEDCSDGSDENEHHCKANDRTCEPNMFKCDNGQCILQKWVCDHTNDCSDNSDELNCPPRECPTNFRRCEHGMCIDKQMWCDGNNDCGDFSDESNCVPDEDLTIVCGDEDKNEKKFQCKFNKTMCLNISMRCDGNPDCPNGEDELDCDGCSIHEFKCGADECIRQEWRCDGQKDCRDGSDERNCNDRANMNHTLDTSLNRLCSDTEFKCKNGLCIDWDRVCDRNTDCSDGSDEDGVCNTSCTDGHPCDHKCKRSPNGPVCGCRDGYALQADKKSCADINECTNGDFPCAQKCENTIGSYRCSCFSGFALRSDKLSCKSLEETKFTFYSAFDAVFRLKPYLTKVVTANNSKIIGLDMNFDRQLLYFTVEDQEALYEFNWTNSQMNSVQNIGNPTQVAVDWITNNVYFIDKSSESSIKICHINDKRCVTLITFKEREHVKALAVDPLNHHLFYAVQKIFDFTMPESKIFMHNLDGTKKQLIAEGAFFIPAIACDFYTERLYYVNLESKSVWSVKYDGTEKRMAIGNSEYIKRPNKINLFESHVIVLNSGSNVVAQCALYGNKECKSFNLNVNQPDNLIIAQKSRQKYGENMCAHSNCSTICVPSELGSKCICDFGSIAKSTDMCNDVTNTGLKNPNFVSHQNASEAQPASTFKVVLGTISLILLLLSLVTGSIYVYKRKFNKRNFNISMHFKNPKSTFETACVKICQLPEVVRGAKLNEIRVYRQESQKEATTMEEENDYRATAPYRDDDTRNLLA